MEAKPRERRQRRDPTPTPIDPAVYVRNYQYDPDGPIIGADLNRPSEHIIALATPQRIIKMAPYLTQVLKLVRKLRWYDYAAICAGLVQDLQGQVILQEAEQWAKQSHPNPAPSHQWDTGRLASRLRRGIPLIRQVAQGVQVNDRGLKERVRRGDLYERCEDAVRALETWLRLLRELGGLVKLSTLRPPMRVSWKDLARKGLQICRNLKVRETKGLYEEVRRVQRRWALLKADSAALETAIQAGFLNSWQRRVILQRLLSRRDVRAVSWDARRIKALIDARLRRLAPRLTELHDRKGRLKKAIYAEARLAVARVLIAEHGRLLAIEDLQMSTRGAWRILAKYITDMLVRRGFMDEAAALATHYHSKGMGRPVEEVAIEVVRVNPAGTSKYCATHRRIPLKPVLGEWDVQWCPQGRQFAQRHGNSSRLVALRARELLQRGVP